MVQENERASIIHTKYADVVLDTSRDVHCKTLRDAASLCDGDRASQGCNEM